MANDGIDNAFELRRMCGGDNHPMLLVGMLFTGEYGSCSMRAPDLAPARFTVSDGFADLLVAYGDR